MRIPEISRCSQAISEDDHRGIRQIQSDAPELVESGVDVRAVELRIHWLRERPRISLLRVGDESVFEFTEPKSDASIFDEKLHKASAVLAPFLKVCTPEQGLQFLGATGYFLYAPSMHDEFRVISPGFKVTTLSWNAFQTWQKLIRQIVSEGFPHVSENEEDPDGIYVGPTSFQSFRQTIADAPHTTKRFLQGPHHVKVQQELMSLSIEAFSTMDAVLASLCVDSFAHINRRLCARDGCPQLVVQKTRREKLYCSPKCAHHANVTKIRKETPEEKEIRKEKGKFNG